MPLWIGHKRERVGILLGIPGTTGLRLSIRNSWKLLNQGKFLARPERLELPTYWFEASRSIQLSYGRARVIITGQNRFSAWTRASSQAVVPMNAEHAPPMRACRPGMPARNRFVLQGAAGTNTIIAITAASLLTSVQKRAIISNTLWEALFRESIAPCSTIRKMGN